MLAMATLQPGAEAVPAAHPPPPAAPPPSPPARRRHRRARRRADARSADRPDRSHRSACPVYPERAVHHVVRRGSRSALLSVRASAPFVEVVTFYRTALKQKGDVLFETPPTHQFETGRFRDETMAFPPSVTIKDYTFGGSAGLSQSEAGRTAAALPDSHPDRARRRPAYARPGSVPDDLDCATAFGT